MKVYTTQHKKIALTYLFYKTGELYSSFLKEPKTYNEMVNCCHMILHCLNKNMFFLPLINTHLAPQLFMPRA